MVLTLSNMPPIGHKAPDFNLLDVVTNESVSLKDIKSEIATVIMFICNHCPYVKHILKGMVDLSLKYIPKGIVFVAINSNDVVEYPEDSPENMEKVAKKFDFPFRYLFDESQKVAIAYKAACTPDFFIYDGDLKNVYRGQFDDSRPGNSNDVNGKDIADVLDSLLNNETVSLDQKASSGCSIKWKYGE